MGRALAMGLYDNNDEDHPYSRVPYAEGKSLRKKPPARHRFGRGGGGSGSGSAGVPGPFEEDGEGDLDGDSGGEDTTVGVKQRRGLRSNCCVC